MAPRGRGGIRANFSRGALSGRDYDGPPVHGEPNPLGIHFAWTRLSAFTDELSRVSGGATFDIVTWCDVEPSSGRYDWGATDEAVTSASHLGLRVFLKLETGTCWATEATDAASGRRRTISSMPRSLVMYAAFVRSVVERYRGNGVDEFAVENEVNDSTHWSGSEAQYDTLVATAARAVHSVEPSAIVLDGAISSTGNGAAMVASLESQGHVSDALSLYRSYFARRFGTDSSFPPVSGNLQLRHVLASSVVRRDVLYAANTVTLADSHVIDAVQVHYYETWQDVAPLVSYLRGRLPHGFPLQAWEVGEYWPSSIPGNDDVHAAEAVRTAASFLAAGVTPVVWLPLQYGGNNGSETTLGLLNEDGSPRPAWTAWLRLTNATSGTSVRLAPYRGSGLTGLVAGTATQTTLIVWSATSATLPRIPAGFAASNLFGSNMAVGPGPFVVGASPVFLSGPLSMQAAVAQL